MTYQFADDLQRFASDADTLTDEYLDCLAFTTMVDADYSAGIISSLTAYDD
jgi:hypothetical protein